MGTQASSLQPPPNPARIQFVDKNGMLTQVGYWFLYNLFTGAQNAEATAVLEAFDSTGDSASSEAKTAALWGAAEDPAPLNVAQINEAKLLSAMPENVGLDRRKLEDLSALAALLGDAPGVQYLNGMVGALSILAGSGITLTLADRSITIAATPSVPGAWTPFTTTITPSAGTWAPSSQDCAYQQIGKTVYVRMRVTGTPSVAIASLSLSLPLNAKSATAMVLTAVVDVGTPVAATAELSTTEAIIQRYDASNITNVVQNVYAMGVYESA